ncbi:MAG TPA: ABC transporter substrate-binding protein [Solirubrobacteraceae bacterium]|nr:ABC transporter substrate-binding protein [Solirubrobacteraceae bacterium]
MHRWTRGFAAPVSVVALAVAVAACGSSSNNSSTKTSHTTSGSSSASASGFTMPAKNASVAALVPKSIKSKGTLTVASDATYAPDEFLASNGHTVIGMDADLSHALGALMGLKVNLVNATFATIIPGLAAGRYDMGASSFGDTKAREKTVDFVDYAFVGESFYTKSSGGTSIGSIADICGKTVSVESGTTEEADAKTQSGKCTKAGKKGVKVLVFDTQTEANLAVSSGRAQLGFADTPVATYQVKKSNGEFKVVGAPYAPVPYGLAMPKNGLDKSVLAALKVLVNDGTYNKIFSKWGLRGIEIHLSKVKINGATS